MPVTFAQLDPGVCQECDAEGWLYRASNSEAMLCARCTTATTLRELNGDPESKDPGPTTDWLKRMRARREAKRLRFRATMIEAKCGA
jgi:hypothetical protein